MMIVPVAPLLRLIRRVDISPGSVSILLDRNAFAACLSIDRIREDALRIHDASTGSRPSSFWDPTKSVDRTLLRNIANARVTVQLEHVSWTHMACHEQRSSRHTAEQKAELLRQHVAEKKPVSEDATRQSRAVLHMAKGAIGWSPYGVFVPSCAEP